MNTENQTNAPGLSGQNHFQFPQIEASLPPLLGLLPVGCILLDDDFRFKYWNQSAERIFGYPLAEVVGKRPSELIVPGEMVRQFDQILQETRGGLAQMRDMENVAADGSRLHCRWHFTRLNTETPSMLAIVQDVSREKQADEKTQRQLAHIRALRTIDSAISGSMDFQVTLTIILQQAVAQLRMDAATILVYEPSMNTLKYAAGRGLRTDVLQSTSLRIGEGYAGMAALQKKIVQVPDLQNVQQEFSRSARFSKEGFKSYYCVPLIAKGVVKGVMESFHRTPFQADQEWLDFFETLGGQAAIAIDSAMLFDELQRSNLELTHAYDSTLEGWSKALDMRDRDTEGHTRRVTEMTGRLALEFNLKDSDQIHIRRGAILHDIGKMAIPDSILLKEDALSEEEWSIMRQHPVLAMNMLSSIDYLRPALDIPFCHHEKWDGSGYPRGLKGEQIPLSARIFAVVDVFDALTSDRPYRRAWPVQQALDYIQSESGMHFDSEVVTIFMRVIGRLAVQGWR